MKPPRLSSAQVDWAAAIDTLSAIGVLRSAMIATRSRRASSGALAAASRPLSRLNAVMSQRFAGIAVSPVPVLLPFDAAALMRDLAAGTATTTADNSRYLSGFHTATFLHAGPSGYDAAFAIDTRDHPDLADIKFRDPIEVQISGSVLQYQLDDPSPATGAPVPTLEADFPGIARLIHEHRLRYTFVRFGVPYAVAIRCFDGPLSRFRMPTCRVADRVALRFLAALRVAGGTPERPRTIQPIPVERPRDRSPTFTYYGPGQLLPNTSFRGRGGQADYTVYSQIRFPVAEAPAYANSQMYERRNRSRTSDPNVSPNYSYPWRDNFCERRGFEVGQCPAGIGHQGQDIRTPLCRPEPGQSRCEQHDEIVAVRGGVILRSPKQEAAYLIVNSATEHIRVRYLHMHPDRMDEDRLLSGRRVHEGEVIGLMSNYSKREGGTTYHLHFDVQVPTRHGWVFVNPYMTLVAAYERLIGGRGVELGDPTLAATNDSEMTGAKASSKRPAASPKAAKPKRAAPPRNRRARAASSDRWDRQRPPRELYLYHHDRHH